jgi:hypothetical protein
MPQFDRMKQKKSKEIKKSEERMKDVANMTELECLKEGAKWMRAAKLKSGRTPYEQLEELRSPLKACRKIMEDYSDVHQIVSSSETEIPLIGPENTFEDLLELKRLRFDSGLDARDCVARFQKWLVEHKANLKEDSASPSGWTLINTTEPRTKISQ